MTKKKLIVSVEDLIFKKKNMKVYVSDDVVKEGLLNEKIQNPNKL